MIDGTFKQATSHRNFRHDIWVLTQKRRQPEWHRPNWRASPSAKCLGGMSLQSSVPLGIQRLKSSKSNITHTEITDVMKHFSSSSLVHALLERPSGGTSALRVAGQGSLPPVSRSKKLDNECKPGQCYVGDRLLPMQHTPLSTLVMDPATSQELPEWGWVQWQTALGTPTLDISLRFTPEAIPKEG